LGVRPSDIHHYTIPASCRKSLDENELKEVQLLIKKPFMDKHLRWKEELEEMVKRKEKIDLKSTNKIAMDRLAEYYLPSKLEKKDYILYFFYFFLFFL
jgi:DNA topoisomerase VI subunit A